MTDIKNMTDEEFKEYQAEQERVLKEERRRREAMKLQEQREKNLEMIRFLKDNPQVVEMIPHQRTSCSDKNPINVYDESRGYARCIKCHLLEVLENEDINFQIHLGVSISKISVNL